MVDAMILFCDSASGIYIPQRFINEVKREYLQGVTDEDFNDLSDPNNEWYWDTWDRVLNNATVTDEDGNVYTLWQDGDLWLLCDELMTDEEKLNFYGEDC